MTNSADTKNASMMMFGGVLAQNNSNDQSVKSEFSFRNMVVNKSGGKL